MFKGKLNKIGFKLNDNYPSVVNMTIKRHKLNACWYVDDAKISQKDPAVVSDIIT